MANDSNNIVCEKCNTMYRYDASKIPPGGRKVRCSTCGHIFVAMPKVAAASVRQTLPDVDMGAVIRGEERGDDEEDNELQLDEDETGVRKAAAETAKKNRILLRQDGTRYAVQDMAMLQRWIVERRVSREAEMSLDGEVWERVSGRTDLAPFFSIVERNRSRKTVVRKDPTGEFKADALQSSARAGEKAAIQAGAGAVTAGDGAGVQNPVSGGPAGALGAGAASTAANAATPAAGPAREAAAAGAGGGATASAAGAVSPSAQAASTPASLSAPVIAAAAPSQEHAGQNPAPLTPAGVTGAAKALYGVGGVLLLIAAGYVLLKPPANTGTSGQEPIAATAGADVGTGAGGASGAVTGQDGGALGGSAVGTSAAATGVSASGSGAGSGASTSGARPAATSGQGTSSGSATPAGTGGAAINPAAGTGTAGTASRPGVVKPPVVKPETVATAPNTTPRETPKPVTPPAATPKPEAEVAPPALSPAEKVAMAVPSGNAAALVKAGASYLRKEQYAEAVASYRKAVELSPGNASIMKDLGWALHHQSQVDYRNSNSLKDESIQAFKRALGLNSRYADAYYGLGVVYFEAGSRNEAYSNLKAALDNGLKGKDNITEVRSFLSQLEAQGVGGQ